MSRQDYEAIAEDFRIQLHINKDLPSAIITKVALEAIAHRLALTFGNDNPRFIPAKFMKACGF